MGVSYVYSQYCDASVPNIVVDLSSNPDTTWVLKEVDAPDRSGQCCGASGSDECISFDITLNDNAAGIFFHYDGANAYGSLGWQIDCGPLHDLRDTICVSDTGPFTLTFCKPGTDGGNYTLISVSKPTFPEDQFVPANCQQPVEILGVTATSPTWTSITPGTTGDYDHLLSCTDCLEPVFTPEAGIPSEIEYEVCGYPILDYCVGNFLFCDTVKFTTLDSLKLFVDDDFKFCSGGSVNVSASATGGDGSYTFLWYDDALTQIGTGTSININTPGTYTVEVRDGNYITGYCDDFRETFTVSESSPPVVDAGTDQVLCGQDPETSITGTVENATGGIWSGGNGVYTSSNTDLSLSYFPTATEIDNGQVTLRLSSTDPYPGCTNTYDEVTLFYIDSIKIDMSDVTLGCSNSKTTITPTVTGGLNSLTYEWTNGITTLSNTLGEGTHCLTVTDENGCSKSECITITTPDPLSLTMSSGDVTSNGGSDGSATATPGGGISPYTYAWSNSGTNQTETGLSYGVYTVTVTDDNGCAIEGSVVVNEPRCSSIAITIDKTDALCNGGTGEATANVSGGASPFDYTWDDLSTQTTQTASDLTAGVYTVTVEDNNACFATETVTITEPTALSNTMTHTNATTQGGSDGTATANVSGGTGSYDYVWSTSEITSSISGLSAGWYYVDITDDNSCVLTDSVYISEPPCDKFYIYVGTNPVTCNGDTDGEANLVIENGTSPYNITWSTGQTNVTDISGLDADVFTVEVTDDEGCYAFQTFGVAEPSTLSLGLKATPSTCLGDNNGTIDATVSGGNFPSYYFAWSNGKSTEDIINLQPDSYTLTVTDEKGCNTSASATLVDPTLLEISYTTQDATCFGYTDASIDITPTGGTPSYSYSWSNGETTEDLTNIDFGTYILDITDANNCSPANEINISINQPDSVKADFITINCPNPGDNTTLVDVTPIGGTADYYISSDGGGSYGSLADYQLSLDVAKNYDIRVKDVNDCISEIYTISIDTNVYIDDITFNTCYYSGQTAEDIAFTPAGGTSDYSISTDSGTNFNADGDYVINLGIATSYNVIAKDSKGCLSETYTIELPDILDLNLAVSSDYNGEDISCFGASDGGITSTMTGGTSPYTYNWSNGETTETIDGLSAGNYTLNLTDDNGCVISQSITLNNPLVLNASISVVSDYNGEDVSCYGSSDGIAEVIPSGGVSPYTYDWSNGSTNQQASGLSAGSYSVQYTDLNGCSKTISIDVLQPDTLNIEASIVDVSCNGGNDGSIDITPSGGVTPYTYQWDHGPINEDVNTLSANSYSITLTDANNCFYVLENLVVDPTAIQLSVTVTDALCYGDANGSIDLTAEGGTPPYDFDWTNGEITEDINDLIIGDYTVTVTDDNGCYTDITGTVNQPDSLKVDDIISHVTCFSYSNGYVDVSVYGGTQPYYFTWSNGDDIEDLLDVTAGIYSLYLEDEHGCNKTKEYTVTEPDLLVATLESPLNFHGHNIDFNGDGNGQIITTVEGGTQPYYYDWSNGDDTKDISNLEADEYTLYLTDINGCSYEVSIKLTEPLELELPTAFSPNGDNDNETYFVRGIEAYPNNKLIVTNRWGNVIYTEEGYHNTWIGTTPSGESLPDGTYYIILEIRGETIDGEPISLKDFVEIRRK